MKKGLMYLLAAVFMITILIAPEIYAQDENQNMPRLKWITGPGKVDLGDKAQIKLPKKYKFLGGDDTRTLMELYGNPPTGKEVGYVTPASESWVLVFDFDDIGYVKDDEKDKLDPDAILESYKEGTEGANKWREEKGIPPLYIAGWHTKPRYDEKTHNLEWAMLTESQGQKAVNYNIRYLGRHGVMEVTLITSVEGLAKNIADTRKLLNGYEFKSGSKYSEFASGDKIAEYGLAALITGGTIAAAAKFGFFKKFWKLLVAGVVAIGAFIKKFFRSLFGREEKIITQAQVDTGGESGTSKDA